MRAYDISDNFYSNVADQNSGIDSSQGASVRHADSAITDAHGETVAYRSCAAGKDYPLQVTICSVYRNASHAVHLRSQSAAYTQVLWQLDQ